MNIIWTSNEKYSLAHKVVELRKAYPTENLLKLFNRAQDLVLDSSRKRDIKALAPIKWLVYEVEAIERGSAKPESSHKPEIEDVAQQLAKRISSLVLAQISNELTPILDTFKGLNQQLMRLVVDISVEKPAENAVSKKNILIVGLLKQQEQVIASDFSHLGLKFVDQNKIGNLKDSCKNADLVISMTKFISHATDYALTSTVRCPYKRVDGGLSSLRKELSNL